MCLLVRERHRSAPSLVSWCLYLGLLVLLALLG